MADRGGPRPIAPRLRRLRLKAKRAIVLAEATASASTSGWTLLGDESCEACPSAVLGNFSHRRSISQAAKDSRTDPDNMTLSRS
jgi:hypothetical protein